MIQQTTSVLTWKNRLDRWLARLRVRRMGHLVQPGLYALGIPREDSPVFVSANYTLSFDALRQALSGRNGWILVLDTSGVNVWCAAGKGTFGTDELVRRVQETGLHNVVKHRTLILPQLGAPGVCAHEVKRRSGFRVEYGPVRAADLREYLNTRRATADMRKVRFGLRDRLAVIPVEVVGSLLYLIPAAVLAFFVGGRPTVFMLAASVFAGTMAFPILLPWLPTKDFSSKGFILGGIVILPFVLAIMLRQPGHWLLQTGFSLSCLSVFVPVTAFLALNFTGSTTFTSKSRVKREIYRYFPVMAWMFGAGLVLGLALAILRLVGVRA